MGNLFIKNDMPPFFFEKPINAVFTIPCKDTKTREVFCPFY